MEENFGDYIMSSYKKTKLYWLNRHKNDIYAKNLTKEKLVKITKNIINKYGPIINEKCITFCELGVGSARNIFYFNEEYPNLKYFGNDLNPNTHIYIKKFYPDLLSKKNIEISIKDTFSYLKNLNSTDVIFTYGHLMHIPDKIIEEVCNLISKKSNKFIILYEAYVDESGLVRKMEYRFGRDYSSMFKDWQLKEKEITKHIFKKGIVQALYLFERRK